jgi:hypothetical protein
MRRLAWTFSIISGVVLIIGLIDYLTNYNWAQGDQDPLFGNPRILLNDGATLLIGAGFLIVGSVLMWIVALRRERGDVRREHGDQRQS